MAEYRLTKEDTHAFTASYAVGVLSNIASGALVSHETPAEYAQRHLDALVKDGSILRLDDEVGS